MPNRLGAAFRLAVLILAVASTAAHEQYSTLGDLLHWYAHAAQTHPSLVRYTELREPGYDRAILPLATFTNYGVDEARGPNKSSVLLVFGEHARELITCEVGLWFSRVLLGDTAELYRWAEWPEAFKPLGIAPEDIPATIQGWVQRILENLVIKLLPVENVDGRQAWEGGNLCLRKTSKGVDLNRNYPFAFVTEPSLSEMYGGMRPFSEAQSRLIARLALEGGSVPKAYINVHSGEWAVYSGWDSKAAVGPGLPGDLSDLLLRSGDVCRCQAGPAGAVSNYLAFGTGMDFMYTQLGVPYALTYEVYGRSGPHDSSEPGRLPEGARNKPLSEYPYVSDAGIARELPRLDDILGPPLPHHHYLQQHQRHRGHQHHKRVRVARAGAARLVRSASEPLPPEEGLGGSGAAAAAVGPLGGRSMRRLAAAAVEGRSAWEEGAVAVGATAEVAAEAQAGSGGRALTLDMASSPGPDGPILDMVRKQPGFHQSCFDMFNPPPGAAYRDVVSRWVVILLMTLNHVAAPAHPKPSPHPLPGTVLAGVGAGGGGAEAVRGWGFGGAKALGRRRLLEMSVLEESGAGGDAEGVTAAAGREEVSDVRASGREAAAALVVKSDAGVRVGNGQVEEVAAAAGGDLYGSASFDRRAQQQLVYEVDPEMRQRSLVVAVAILVAGVLFVPWLLCAAQQAARPLPAASRRGRMVPPPPPPSSRVYI